MNRSLAAILLGATLLLAGCSDDKPEASRPSPDQYSRGGCALLAQRLEKNDHGWILNGSVGGRAARSTDPAVSAAGRELVLAVKDAGDLDVSSHGKADMTQAEARIADAQQKLMTACRELLGEPPWSDRPDA
ncbi:hypothetical protein ONA91_29745 [Micromonospora sp. DR5-3]|uniref:hypothetical protein n=1 Tax=unclassified Micromonospora TaxID=2617518 RepID=UPI0011DAAC37|nr:MULTISPECIES: hypothetical protein [unclassified Micromonospora]MCW3818630.1 hypothetical protein [Micromonospora sp. DR5-3]TYC19780.1 hypothetical protein FXF52_34805 [Micromonospora sp. MP36]